MDSIDLIKDAFSRIADELPGRLEGMSARSLLHRAQRQGNSVSWLAFTMARRQDRLFARIGGTAQVWDQGWRERFDLPESAETAEDERFRVVDVELLNGYYRAVAAASAGVLESGAAENLDRVLEGGRSVGSSLVDLLNEITKDMGQIAFLRGLTDSIKAMRARRRTG
ncbi:hypothetical protein [uncultured Propionibacterium sp.]|uniref:hypothetical protein n=1 Tax=uncultured Propionibacterium sp. TaxID=218066 RepID=UPI00292ECC12|nr:hypothetical protein [uncultured Propionibacterium sp.]